MSTDVDHRGLTAGVDKISPFEFAIAMHPEERRRKKRCKQVADMHDTCVGCALTESQSALCFVRWGIECRELREGLFSCLTELGTRSRKHPSPRRALWRSGELPGKGTSSAGRTGDAGARWPVRRPESSHGSRSRQKLAGGASGQPLRLPPLPAPASQPSQPV